MPLQLDSSNPDALEAGLRVYNGKAAVNSVNGEPEVLERVLPIVKKYGASVVGLTLDKNGIPKTAEERVAIARRILQAALDHGIPREDRPRCAAPSARSRHVHRTRSRSSAMTRAMRFISAAA